MNLKYLVCALLFTCNCGGPSDDRTPSAILTLTVSVDDTRARACDIAFDAGPLRDVDLQFGPQVLGQAVRYFDRIGVQWIARRDAPMTRPFLSFVTDAAHLKEITHLPHHSTCYDQLGTPIANAPLRFTIE